ncbi:MAG: hypothetical protein OZSIB_0797 [Candidatus Ozemobacter sibiricus]|uniref:Uncharacterized protein n=1 Tax=Candidatus Ozemobacter sibiricus TaxID=2268124 RepID=A0A367ZU41_9BACT|nr:MAG: hypothetical protein OZSIB_0797 [Candidatus Ozemobacter sibiricus]
MAGGRASARRTVLDVRGPAARSTFGVSRLAAWRSVGGRAGPRQA